MSPNHPMTLMACEALLVVFGLGEEDPGFVRYLSKAGWARGGGHDAARQFLYIKIKIR